MWSCGVLTQVVEKEQGGAQRTWKDSVFQRVELVEATVWM